MTDDLVARLRASCETSGKPTGRHMIEGQRALAKVFAQSADEDARNIAEVALCMATCIENEARLFNALRDVSIEAADEIERLRAELAAAQEKTSVSLTVGGGLEVYGTMDAIHRVQRYILLDSRHPVESADVRRSLARALKAAEAERDALRELLLRWDALIKHQYSGSREAMSDMMECAQKTAQTLYGDPPWPTRIDAALKGDNNA